MDRSMFSITAKRMPALHIIVVCEVPPGAQQPRLRSAWLTLSPQDFTDYTILWGSANYGIEGRAGRQDVAAWP